MVDNKMDMAENKTLKRESVIVGSDRNTTLWSRQQVEEYLGVKAQMIYVYVKHWGLTPKFVIGTNYFWESNFVENWAKANKFKRVGSRYGGEDEDEETISTNELRERLKISRETVHLLIGMGLKPAITHGRFYRWNYNDVVNWVKENRPSIFKRMEAREARKSSPCRPMLART